MVKHLHQYQTLPLQEMDWDIPMCVAGLEYAGLEDIFMSVGGNGLEYVGLEGIIMYIAGLDKNCPMSIARNDLEFAALEDIIIMYIAGNRKEQLHVLCKKRTGICEFGKHFLVHCREWNGAKETG